MLTELGTCDQAKQNAPCANSDLVTARLRHDATQVFDDWDQAILSYVAEYDATNCEKNNGSASLRYDIACVCQPKRGYPSKKFPV